jgi:hypothetical protein
MLLGRSAGTIIGEIAGDAAVRLIAGLSPNSSVLDGSASGVNPLVVLPALAAPGACPARDRDGQQRSPT